MKVSKLGVSVINNLAAPDAEGFYEGVVLGAEIGTGSETVGRRSRPDERNYERCEIRIAFPGTQEPYIMKTHTGTKLNPRPVVTKYSKQAKEKHEPIRNQFTVLMIALGALTLEELETLPAEDIKVQVDNFLENIEGLKIKCKIVTSEEGFWRIDFDTIEVVE